LRKEPELSCEKSSRASALAPRLFRLMFVDDFLRGGQAATAATTYWHLHLHFAQRSSATVEGVANLSISDAVADANVHAIPLIKTQER
jgi:hypothetical protein